VMLDEDALAELDPDAHEIVLLRSERLGKASEAPSSVSCTRRSPGLPRTRLSPAGRSMLTRLCPC
jgi:hypothetical protein